MPNWTLYEGDCLEVMRQLPDNSVDAVVTDPPYGLEFMSVAWDTFSDRSKGTPRVRNEWQDFGSREHPRNAAEQAKILRKKSLAFYDFSRKWASEVHRVLKPGGHLLAFGGTRTYHRLACAIEDAGFEVRDCLMWLYGSGFPKSMDISKAIDKKLGAERRVVGSRTVSRDFREAGRDYGEGYHGQGYGKGHASHACAIPITAPATEAARQWDGWGTALKPAVEPIILARKPLSEKTVAENVLKWGTGGLNIDGCRIPGKWERSTPHRQDNRGGRFHANAGDQRISIPPQKSPPGGRFPANILLDEEAAAMLDEQSGIRQGGARPARRGPGTKVYHGWPNGTNDGVRIEYEGGGASRFFYVAKASRSERTMGGKVENNHPTVKPIKLMRYLCRLITPPGGTVLDPFAGSGTTLIAAVAEGFSVIGIEREPEYCEIIRQRMQEAVQVALPMDA